MPIDPMGTDAIRPLATPSLVTVREGPDHQPVAVRLGKQWREVARIEDRWCFDLWWLPKPLTRAYYRVSWEDRGAGHPVPGPAGALLVSAGLLGRLMHNHHHGGERAYPAHPRPDAGHPAKGLGVALASGRTERRGH